MGAYVIYHTTYPFYNINEIGVEQKKFVFSLEFLLLSYSHTLTLTLTHVHSAAATLPNSHQQTHESIH